MRIIPWDQYETEAGLDWFQQAHAQQRGFFNRLLAGIEDGRSIDKKAAALAPSYGIAATPLPPNWLAQIIESACPWLRS